LAKYDLKIVTELFKLLFTEEEIVKGNQSGQPSRAMKLKPGEERPQQYSVDKLEYIYTTVKSWLNFLGDTGVKVAASRLERMLFAMYIRDAASPFKKVVKRSTKDDK
jgi:hypothetical protein